jgi:hypothetical protein
VGGVSAVHEYELLSDFLSLRPAPAAILTECHSGSLHHQIMGATEPIFTVSGHSPPLCLAMTRTYLSLTTYQSAHVLPPPPLPSGSGIFSLSLKNESTFQKIAVKKLFLLNFSHFLDKSTTIRTGSASPIEWWYFHRKIVNSLNEIIFLLPAGINIIMKG